jgi:hypothetical protein
MKNWKNRKTILSDHFSISSNEIYELDIYRNEFWNGLR